MLGSTAFLNEKGGFIDDVMIYRLSEDEYLIIGNAANREKDYKWIRNNAVRMGYNLKIVDKTFETAMLAVQGPNSIEIVEKISDENVGSLAHLAFLNDTNIANVKAFILSRSGWTGEEGFEIIIQAKYAENYEILL